MTTVEFNLLGAIESHSVDEIRRILDEGFDVRTPIKGKSVLAHLTEMYSRSDQFPGCLRLLLERGARLDDPRIGPVLLDDADGLSAALRADPSLIEHRTSMVSAFTPLIGASLLHVAAEFGNLQAARVLLELGADVNATASVDEHGFNGHTPLFHTVNSNANRSAPLMRLLLDAGPGSTYDFRELSGGEGWNGRPRSLTSHRSLTLNSVCCRKSIARSAISMKTSACSSKRLAGTLLP